MTLDLSSVACSKRGEVWWYVSLGTRHSGGGSRDCPSNTYHTMQADNVHNAGTRAYCYGRPK